MLAVRLKTVLAAFIALLPIANPFSTSALFPAMTAGDTEAQRRRQAKTGFGCMFGIVFAPLIAGGRIMRFPLPCVGVEEFNVDGAWDIVSRESILRRIPNACGGADG